VQAFALLKEGIPVPQIIEYTTLTKFTVHCIKKITYKWGYDPTISYEFKDKYFDDALCTEQLKVITEESSTKVLQLVKENCKGREIPAKELEFLAGVSEVSALQIFQYKDTGRTFFATLPRQWLDGTGHMRWPRNTISTDSCPYGKDSGQFY
jgi:hypothetical protein